MTEEEQLQAAMMASMGGDASSAIDIPDEEPEDVSTPLEDEGRLAYYLISMRSLSSADERCKVLIIVFSLFVRLDPLPEVEVVEESVFDSIKPVRHEEPTDLATSTRIGFRLSDGSRLMHRFPKSAPVRALFEYIKSEVEDARTQQFEAS